MDVLPSAVANTSQTSGSIQPIAPADAEAPILGSDTILQQRYEIIKLRARGGMSTVYEARDLRFSHTFRRCAIKEIVNAAPDLDTRRLNLQSFEREANILASLSHPAIPHIFDYFAVGSRAYLVLEYIEGEDLQALLEHTTSFLPPGRVVRWILQICDVLEYLHTRPQGPIIFRDIKPSNIMLLPDDRVMLVDFGIAKVFLGRKRGTMVGTEGYAPPEQYRGLAGQPGDIYALGATMHHLLTRRDPRLEPPFSFRERLPSSINPAVSAELEAVVMKAVEYDPEKRFATVSEFALALQAAIPASERIRIPALLRREPEETRQPLWQFSCDDEVRASPIVHEGILYIGSYDHHLYALNANTGQLIWKYRTEAGICATACVADEKALFGSEDMLLYAVSQRGGRIIWTCPTDGRIRSSPLAVYGHVFFGSDDGCLYALHADSGRIIWRFRAGGPIRSRPALAGELVVFGCEDGQVYAVDMGSGELRWKQRTAQGIVSSPAVGDSMVYIGSRDWHLHALNARSGWPVWRFRTGNAVLSTPAIADNRLYVGSVDGSIYAIDARNGRQIWRYATEGQVTSSAAIWQDALYVGSVDTHLYSLEINSGKLRWRYRTGGTVPGSPVVAEGRVYIGSTDGYVYALPL